jgi:tetratricopeptide (TPR) repeat protein
VHSAGPNDPPSGADRRSEHPGGRPRPADRRPRGPLPRLGPAWGLPDLPADQPDRLRSWAFTATGFYLDVRGSIRTLDAPGWARTRAALAARGGDPFPAGPGSAPEANRHLIAALEAAQAAEHSAVQWHLRRHQAVRGGPPPPWLLRELARLAELRNDRDGAIAWYREAVHSWPEDGLSWQDLGAALWNRGNRDEAVAALQKAAAFVPDNALVHENLRYVLSVMAPRPTGPGTWLDGACRLAAAVPGSGLGLGMAGRALIWARAGSGELLLGAIHERTGDLDAAIEAYRRALRLDPGSADGHARLARALRERTLRSDRPDLRAEAASYIALGDERRSHQDPPGAFQAYRKAAMLDPSLATAYSRLAGLLAAANQPAQALAFYGRAIALDPKDPRPWNSRAWLRATYRDPAFRDGRLAVADAQRAAELSGQRDASILDTLAAALAEAGDFAEAARWETRAIELDDRADFRDRLAAFQEGRPYRAPGRLAAVPEEPPQ